MFIVYNVFYFAISIKKSSILHSADDSDDKNNQKPKSKMTFCFLDLILFKSSY